ncbi:MAG: hypothetical protein N2234_10340 [Planctomycetota bacterium]|nr:hypothetical protein [Planctomycetota bacterium]
MGGYVLPLDEKAKAVIEDAIEVMGGEKRILGMKDITISRRYASFEDIIRHRMPDRILRESNFPWASLSVGYDGSRSWVKATDGSVSYEEGMSAAVQWLFHYVDTLLLLRLLTSEASVEHLGGKSLVYFEEGEMVQKPVFLIRVTFPDGWVFRLYFAKDKFLPVKEEYRHTVHQSRYVECYFNAHKRFKHILLPQKIYELNPFSRAIKRVRVNYEINKGLHRRSFNIPAQVQVEESQKKVGG